jgi:DNA-binding transcriptional LysR family regulator
MEWDEVRYFLAVARSRSLIAAARSLKVSAATVARRIDALEKRLGARLFERRQTGYVLTDSGEGICAEAEAAEESTLALERKASVATSAYPARCGSPPRTTLRRT